MSQLAEFKHGLVRYEIRPAHCGCGGEAVLGIGERESGQWMRSSDVDRLLDARDAKLNHELADLADLLRSTPSGGDYAWRCRSVAILIDGLRRRLT